MIPKAREYKTRAEFHGIVALEAPDYVDPEQKINSKHGEQDNQSQG